jgi:P4 family phage/plasmid primase-like protien
MMNTAPINTSPQIDAEAIVAYVELVFGYLEGQVPIRLLAETGTPDQKPRVEFCAPTQLATELVRLAPWAAANSRGLFVVPGTVAKPGFARARDILETGVLLVDIDSGDVEAICDHLTAHLGAPSMEVASGGTTDAGVQKRHLYWRLTEAATGEDLGQIRALRQIVSAKVHSDASFDSLHQPIRVPGSIHGKHGRQVPVVIQAHRSLEYELRELLAAADAMPPLPSCGKTTQKPDQISAPRARELMQMPVRAGGIDVVTRFDAISKVIGHWLLMMRLGNCTANTAWANVVNYNAAMVQPPWEESRLLREFNALARRDADTHGPIAVATGPSHALTDRDGSGAPAFSDDALAAAFVAEHADIWRHVGAWSAWYRWNGRLWQRDETSLVREQMRHTCRRAANVASTPAEARRLASDKTISSALRIAAADPRITTRVSDWDCVPMLLNTPAGVIDLETGETLAHSPDRLVTQITAASPGDQCPVWVAFLEEITAGDTELQAFLKRLAGYCLTGSTREQSFTFLHGSGANGKSVFINVLAFALGDYAATATLATFMASRTDRHLTELAGLRAARLVIVPETETGQTWAEARIKVVTGGEKLRANFMHRDHFEFTPQFKLVVIGNHRPALTSVGEAMRRRLHLVPFAVTIPAEKRDPRLIEKLQAERDGILGWALEGCAEWQRIGLKPPQAVLKAAEEYFGSEDALGQWIEEACTVGPERKDTSRALYCSWSAWAESTGHPKGSQKLLSEALRERGFRPGKVDRARGWLGISLRPVLNNREDKA